MLDPWALTNSRWKKRIAAVLFEDRHLRGAACIHALCQSESESIRAYGLKNPIAIIPNGVVLPKANVECEMGNVECKPGDAGVFKEENHGTRYPLPATRNAPLRLLFLGRLHPKKGLVQALKSWAKIQNPKSKIQNYPSWQFVIAGWDQGGHEAELKRRCSDLNLPFADIPASDFLAENCKLPTENSNVAFVGPAFGEEKDALLRSADAFILPSLSEGLPMSVLEAWAYGLPVLMTPECNLPEGFAADAAVRIGAEDAKKAESGKLKAESCGNIEGGLQTLFEMSEADRVAMGERGRRLVEERFTWPKIAAQMKEVYEWVLGGGPKPDCVFGPVK
jgi:poly(glycerol-phosphate) alpha-glucosyltransferase